jgi:hypothetical protein
MGKLAKNKKRRLEQALEKNDDISPAELEITFKTLNYLIKNPEKFQDKEFKPLRRILYTLNQGKGTSLSAMVSDALKNGRWNDAMAFLAEMRSQGQVPKLGALQRWVRDCDAAQDGKSQTVSTEILRVLDAILRTADPSMVAAANPGAEAEHPIRMHPVWSPSVEPHSQEQFEFGDLRPHFREVYREKGMDRRPPNLHDMILYTSDPTTIQPQMSKEVERIDVPNLPGVFVLTNVLAAADCEKMIQCAEQMGMTPDTPSGGSAKDLTSVLADNFFWLAHEELNDWIFHRCKPFLPQEIQGRGIAGLNARWRLYRYTPGSIYRPHIDGAWPGSGLTPSGKYEYDAYGDRWSKLTFLIRLNDDFEGGATTYFTPSVDVGYMDGRPVLPKQGSVLVFPHGDTEGSILHEGSAVFDTQGKLRDAKYVIRTEVLYMIPGHQRKVLE